MVVAATTTYNDSGALIPTNNIALIRIICSISVGANEIVVCIEPHTSPLQVGQRAGAARIRTDVVAGNHVARTVVLDTHAFLDVAADNVTFTRIVYSISICSYAVVRGATNQNTIVIRYSLIPIGPHIVAGEYIVSHGIAAVVSVNLNSGLKINNLERADLVVRRLDQKAFEAVST